MERVNLSDYTHLAELYGFKCYYNINTSAVKGTNWFNDLMIDTFIWLDLAFFDNEYFKIKLLEQL